MYVPAHHREEDLTQIIAFVRAYPFATLVTTGPDGVPRATHLPVLIEEGEGDAVRLLGHVARANGQGEDLAAGGVGLVIFQGPHAYISPTAYEKPLSVPTWNYVAVHAYGAVRVLEAEEDKRRSIDELVRTFDPAHVRRHQALPDSYILGMLKGIIVFELVVDRWEARYKLSQEKTPAERDNIRAALRSGDDAAARQTADYMQARENA